MASAKTLTSWRFENCDGYVYCSGYLNGRGWETSSIKRVEEMSDHYEVMTQNNIYVLYW